MAKRTKLLDAGELATLVAEREQWLALGRSTQPADRAEAEAGVRATYRAAGRKAPALVLWLDSPWAGTVGSWLLSSHEPTRGQLGDQLWGQLRDQLGGQLGGQLGDQLGGQLGDQLWGQLGDQLWGQLRGQLGDQLGDQLWGQLGDQLGDQLWDQLWGQLGDQLWGQLRGQLGDQLGDQLWGQLGDQLGDQLWDQLWGQLGDQLWDQLWGQLGGQLGDQLWGQLRGQLYQCMYAGHDLAWLGFYEFPRRHLGVTYTEPTAGILAGELAVAASSGWWWPFAGGVIITERPRRLLLDEDGRLHSPEGQAIGYPDGWGFSAWHGLRVPEELIAGWPLERIMREPNQELRRAAIEVVGWDRFVVDADLTPVHQADDPGNPGQRLALYDLPDGLQVYGSPVRLLLCTNGSPERSGIRRRFGLTVPAEASDAVAAAGWTYGLDRDTYAELERRT